MRNDDIRKLANKSLMYGIGALFCCGPILGPIAINYANQTEAAIILSESGADYGSTHKVGRVLGYIAIVLWVLNLVVRLGGLLSSTH